VFVAEGGDGSRGDPQTELLEDARDVFVRGFFLPEFCDAVLQAEEFVGARWWSSAST